jgi:hypothetical protein
LEAAHQCLSVPSFEWSITRSRTIRRTKQLQCSLDLGEQRLDFRTLVPIGLGFKSRQQSLFLSY